MFDPSSMSHKPEKKRNRRRIRRILREKSVLKGLERDPQKTLEDRLWDGLKKYEKTEDDKFTLEFIGKDHVLTVRIIPPVGLENSKRGSFSIIMFKSQNSSLFFKLSQGSAEERKTYQDSYNMYYNYEKLIHERYDNEEDAKLNEERIWQMRFIG